MNQAEEQTVSSQIENFLQGQSDCEKGVPHQSKNKDYTRGYKAQYELEQMNAERTRNGS